MQKWEYLTMAFMGETDEKKEFVINGEGVLRERPCSITDVLNELGEQGWMLAGVTMYELRTPFYILQRPKE